jgi:hypothetical protein
LIGNLPEQGDDPMSEPIEPPTHEIPLDRPAWAVRGVKDRDALTWTREATIDVTITDGGTLDTFAPELFSPIGFRSVRTARPCTSESRRFASPMMRTLRRPRRGEAG